MRFFLILFSLAALNPCLADENQSRIDASAQHEPELNRSNFLPGHNLTPTTSVLKSGQGTLGFYVMGYGVSDQLTVATSPFIIGLYNTAMLDLKYAPVQTEAFSLAIEGMYFKSLSYGNIGPHDHYIQESTFDRLTASHLFSPLYTLNLSVGAQYFWNSDMPYSLDPNPGQNKYVLSISSLSEIHFNSHFGALIEAGVLGLNYSKSPEASDSNARPHRNTYFPYLRANPYSHFGLSAFYQNEKFLFQIGVSRSASTLYSSGSDYTQSDVVYHPEMQLQFYI